VTEHDGPFRDPAPGSLPGADGAYDSRAARTRATRTASESVVMS
jgi:hypothetical protein